jgi:uncharacterized protein YbjQ (UPF0145 family)
MKKYLFVAIILITTLNGCFYAFYPQTGSHFYAETLPETVQIFSGEPEQEYEIIGSITADVIGDADAVVKHLKKKAAKLGADAVIKVDLSKVNSTTLRTGISGVAIKMKDS